MSEDGYHQALAEIPTKHSVGVRGHRVNASLPLDQQQLGPRSRMARLAAALAQFPMSVEMPLRRTSGFEPRTVAGGRSGGVRELRPILSRKACQLGRQVGELAAPCSISSC
jgi:hypothetical protein